MTIWSRWFRGESSPSPGASTTSTPTPSLTVGEVLERAQHPLHYVPVQRCLLCEAKAPVQLGELEAQIECAVCGTYAVSLDAAYALDALVKYRRPALAQMRKMVAAYRQGAPGRFPRIEVQYTVSDGVPTFTLL